MKDISLHFAANYLLSTCESLQHFNCSEKSQISENAELIDEHNMSQTYILDKRKARQIDAEIVTCS